MTDIPPPSYVFTSLLSGLTLGLGITDLEVSLTPTTAEAAGRSPVSRVGVTPEFRGTRRKSITRRRRYGAGAEGCDRGLRSVADVEKFTRSRRTRGIQRR